jgi:hypothetical protein
MINWRNIGLLKKCLANRPLKQETSLLLKAEQLRASFGNRAQRNQVTSKKNPEVDISCDHVTCFDRNCRRKDALLEVLKLPCSAHLRRCIGIGGESMMRFWNVVPRRVRDLKRLGMRWPLS